MMAADAPGGRDGSVTGGQHAAGECLVRQVPRIGAGYRAVDRKVCLTHNGEVCVLPLETAIALRDALSLAIAIPERAAAMAGSG